MSASQDTRDKHYRIKEMISSAEVAAVENSSTPMSAVEKVLAYDYDLACALIDKMTPVGAAMVLSFLRIFYKEDHKAGAIIALATSLGIRGTQGLVAAESEMLQALGLLQS